MTDLSSYLGSCWLPPNRRGKGVPCIAPLLPAVGVAATSPATVLMQPKFANVRSPPAASSLSTDFRGPYAVYEYKRAAKFLCVLRIGQWCEVVSLEQLKPHLGGAAQPADPPRCGRPLGRDLH
jgi:hypothetical protein